MKVIIMMRDGTHHTATFEGLETMESVREWLNGSELVNAVRSKFISVGKDKILNLDYVVEVQSNEINEF